MADYVVGNLKVEEDVKGDSKDRYKSYLDKMVTKEKNENQEEEKNV